MDFIKIAVSGTHSTGKTTFLNDVMKRIKNKSISCSMVSDLAVKCPLPILREHTVESTLWIVTRGISEEIAAGYKSEVVLVDRPVLDAWAYLMAAMSGRPYLEQSPQFFTLENTIRNWLPTYSLIYQTEIHPEIPIDDSKVRDTNTEFRHRVEEEMKIACRKFEVKTKPLSSSNVPQEIEWLINYIEEKFSRE